MRFTPQSHKTYIINSQKLIAIIGFPPITYKFKWKHFVFDKREKLSENFTARKQQKQGSTSGNPVLHLHKSAKVYFWPQLVATTKIHRNFCSDFFFSNLNQFFFFFWINLWGLSFNRREILSIKMVSPKKNSFSLCGTLWYYTFIRFLLFFHFTPFQCFKNSLCLCVCVCMWVVFL